MARTHEPVAVLGMGVMGHGMAASALRAGIPTIVWNRTREATRDLAELGAEVAETAADAAGRAAIVLTMVTDAEAVISIARDQGMLAALAPDAIWVQMSTIGVAGIDRVAAVVGAERPDVTLLDAPVSGSKDPAEHGQLTIFHWAPTVCIQVPTLLTSAAIHSVRNSPMRNGAQGDEADIESAMPLQLPMGNAFGPDPAGVTRYDQSGP